MTDKGKIFRRGVRVFFFILFLSGLNPVVKGAGMPRDTGFWTAASFVYRYEAGVSGRISFQDVFAYTFPKQTDIALTLRFHLNENKGLGLFSFLARRIPGPFRWMDFQAELLHLEYPDFTTGENQFAGLIRFIPHPRFSFMTGMAYRSPDFSDRKMHSPFAWNHQMNEMSLLFNLDWIFLDAKRIRSHLYFGNYTRLTVHNPDHLMLGLRGHYRLKDHISLGLDVRSAVKGVSGFVFSMNELRAEAGLMVCF